MDVKEKLDTLVQAGWILQVYSGTHLIATKFLKVTKYQFMAYTPEPNDVLCLHASDDPIQGWEEFIEMAYTCLCWRDNTKVV